MGAYTDRLTSRRREKKEKQVEMESFEHLVSCAIDRDDVLYAGGYHAHWEIRYHLLGDENPQKGQLGDYEGFLTSTGRFVGRREAAEIGRESGQVRSGGAELLSCDVDKWGEWQP